MYEFQFKWVTETAASSGGLTAARVRGMADNFTFGFTTDAGCTCTVQMQAGPEETGPWVGLETSTAMSTSAYLLQQHAGPLPWLRPYVTAKSTGVLTIEAFGN
jgi:p-aminobenzoyl-glutamate transporter AbgT